MPFYQQPRVLIDEGTLRQRVRELGKRITADYTGKDLVLVGILKGSIFFLADLARAIEGPVGIEFLGVSSYEGGKNSTGQVRMTCDVTRSLQDRHVLVVEDIVDTGLTMKFLIQTLRARQPASLKVCTLLEKPSRAVIATAIDYKGFVVEDVFVVGYGLDFDDQYRNLPYLGILTPGVP